MRFEDHKLVNSHHGTSFQIAFLEPWDGTCVIDSQFADRIRDWLCGDDDCDCGNILKMSGGNQSLRVADCCNASGSILLKKNQNYTPFPE